MSSKATPLVAAVLALTFVLLSRGESGHKHQPLTMTRLYTGSDGQTHAEEIEAKFTAGSTNDVFKLMAITGQSCIVRPPQPSLTRTRRRQYVITLSGHGEIEVAGGKKFEVGAGTIDLVEDSTGKGHITRVVGNEDRVTLQVPLTGQPGRWIPFGLTASHVPSSHATRARFLELKPSAPRHAQTLGSPFCVAPTSSRAQCLPTQLFGAPAQSTQVI